MLRNTFMIGAVLGTMLLGACQDAPGGDEDSASSGATGIVIGPDSSSSASSSSTEPGPEPTTSGGATTGVACVSDDDCGAMYLCSDGVCEFDADWCGEPKIAAIVPPQVMLVLDKSGSMVLNSWDHDADAASPAITRWQSLHSVVELIVAGFDAQMELGAVLFPGKTAKANYQEACLMSDTPDAAVGPMQGAAVLAALPPADAGPDLVQGGTPATAGIELAAGHLASLAAGPKRYLVLVTDGAANCRADAASNYDIAEIYDDALAPAVAAAYTQHAIATFVVGVDIQDLTTPVKQDGQPDATNTYERLNEVAIAGGVPRAGNEKFYNAQNQLDLSAALTAIATQLSCTIDLDPVPTDDQSVELEIDGAAVPEVEGCDDGVGWHFVDPVLRDAIELCADTCAAYQAVAAEPDKLEITYRCKTPG